MFTSYHKKWFEVFIVRLVLASNAKRNVRTPSFL
jgi:hypothetical protein